jgi:hypothetical protein
LKPCQSINEQHAYIFFFYFFYFYLKFYYQNHEKLSLSRDGYDIEI